MQKYGLLLLIAGLAIGLWLGFNPAAHREVVRLWREATVSQARGKPTSAQLSIRRLDTQIARLFRTTPRAQVTTRSQPNTVPGWSQIVAMLQAFWHALQRIWLSIVGSIRR